MALGVDTMPLWPINIKYQVMIVALALRILIEFD